MIRHDYSSKLLTAAVLCSLLTTAPVWAATQTAIDTVTASNTAGTRYTSINVTQESATYKNVIIGIANEPPKTMNVYMVPGATISISSAADGNGKGQRAVGIKNDTKPLTVDEALDLTVTAATAATLQGINMTIIATGVSNNAGDLTLGQAGAANTITVNADAGTYTGAETGSSKASATGIVPGFASLTISGATTLNVSAQGMTPGAGSDVIIAEAVANGIKQEDPGFTSDPIKLGGLTGTISAQGGMVNTGIGSSASAAASGIDNITTLIADSVNLTVQANGGTAGGEASGTDASAAAEGITQYIYSQVGSDVKFTVTGPTTVQVSATGGGYEGTGSASDSSATAMGVGTINTSNMLLSTIRSGIYKLQDVTAVVSAIGGEDNAGSLDPDNPTTGGNVSAVAAGIATNIGSLTAKSLDLTVSAQGGTAAGKNANVNAFAYGLDQSNYMPDNPMDTASLLVTGATKLNVSATGGNTIGTGSANNTITLASGLKNFVTMAPDPGLANMDMDTVSGSVTATGGTVNTERSATTANGVMNGSTDEIGGVLTMNSLNLNVTATGAKLTGTTRKDKTSAVGLEQTGGRTNYGSTSLTITGPATLNVTATGAEPVDNGSLAKTVTKAEGLNIAGSGSEAYTAATLGPVTATVTANGGTANAAQSTVKTSAIGLKSSYDMDIESLDVTVAANGGTVQGTTDDKANKGRLTTYALGISTTTSFKVTGATNFNVTATAGAATDGAVVKKQKVAATGLDLESNILGSNVNLNSVTGVVTATGGTAKQTTDTRVDGIRLADTTLTVAGDLQLTVAGTAGTGKKYAETYVDGIESVNGSTLQVNGNAIIKTSLTMAQDASSGSWGGNGANVLDIYNGSHVYLGTDAYQNSLGKLVQLEGDIWSYSESEVNITLDQSASYLQGNVFADGGTVNLVVANGATWRPVYDNRYASFSEDSSSGEYVNYAPNYTTTENSIETLTLRDGGIVDLTWDNPTRSSEFRTLSVGNLTGNGGVFKLNADLANNKADSISLGDGSTSTQAYIDVAFDPYFAGETLTAGKTITGKATVVTASPTAMTFAGKQDSYNLYTYTPTLVNNGDGTWDLTALTIDSAKTSGHVKSGAQDRLGLNSLFQFETNSLSRRLGELREADGDKTSGVWARYHDGKLEQGNASLKAHLFQAGYDKSSSGKSEKTYRGAALSYAKGAGTYALGTGDVKETTFSLYQTGIKNDGRYYDVVLKAGKYMNDYDVTATANPSSADYDTWAYSISGEMGKRYDLGKGLYVEPQAELILGRLNGADYTTSTGMKVSVDAQNKAITRLGLAFGKSYTRGSLYGKFSYYHDFGSGVNLNAADGGNSVGYSENLARNWTELTIGGSAKLGKNANAYAEVSKYMGQLSSNVRYNIGARWSF